MSADLPSHRLQLVSTATSAGELVVELQETPLPQPGPGQVLIRVEAAPINPSDLIAMLGFLDPATARFEGSRERPRVVLPIPPGLRRAFKPRVDYALPVGNEGAGLVVAAGGGAEALVGRRVGVRPGGMYATYQVAEASDCLVLPDDVTAAEGAACFINPLTVLAMLETLRLEGHSALVHTAAGSALGQMLVKACLEDGIPLVNVVRRPEQAALLRGLGATHVCDSSQASFDDDLARACGETGATVAFDAIGGGWTANRILAAMERAALARLTDYAPYGSLGLKQVYIYGVLEPGPTELARTYGQAWNVGGWLMPAILERVGPARAEALRQRVLAGVRTTFATRYARAVSLAEALQPEVMSGYGRHATGEKLLVDPTLNF